MNEQQWFNRVALLVAVAVAVTGSFVLIVGNEPGPSAQAQATGGPTTVDYLYLTISFNPVTGADQYFPANFSVPAHTPVVITITNYDNGSNMVAPQYLQVTGTSGGDATVWTNGSATPQSMAAVGVGDVAHTFTVLQGSTTLVNVPVPSAGPQGQSTTVRFSAEFDTPGSFTWMCMAMCANDSMATPGFMQGTLTVD